tara:strand:+ start:53 stop:253 length:201 start_codon:yes stop_codon:yes gene_type:complete
MKVESNSQWAANTISFVGVDTLYLRMAAEGQVIWYEMGDTGTLTWSVDAELLNRAWAWRNFDEDLQ